MEYLILDETVSTNSFIKKNREALSAPLLVRAVSQTGGRGQRGNSWEAAPGENLTFSILWKPEGIAPREQFAVSEAVALGVVSYLSSRGIGSRVKWPNDIYVGDRKICGILIEHSVTGMELDQSIIGVGVNVNQIRFLSDAPNPVSMSMLTGEVYSLDHEMHAVGEEIAMFLGLASASGERDGLHREFMRLLWRGDDRSYPFRDCLENRIYAGKIADVEPSGHIIIMDEDGTLRKYAFKEIEFML